MKLRPEVQEAMLTALKRAYDESTGSEQSLAIFRAIDFCGEQELVMPQWVWWGFGTRLAKWHGMKVGSLDDAFGLKKITPTRLANMRRNKLLRFEILNRIAELERQKKPVPWDDLEKELGASKRKLQDLYYGGKLLNDFSNSQLKAVYDLLLEPFAKKS